MTKQAIFFLGLTIITCLFCLAIAVDFTPLLRGPAPYPPEWQWEYFFVNTFSRIYLPLFVASTIMTLLWVHEQKKFFKQKIKTVLFLLIVFSFLLQMSILFFSRTGIPVLIHRIINPELNSYFTASLQIDNPITFLENYNDEMKHFVYHARSHPPGAILIFYGIKQIMTPLQAFMPIIQSIRPNHLDVREIWDSLKPVDQGTGVLAAFLLPFLSTLAIIPVFKTAKILYGEMTAMRASFIYSFIPSIIFFIPINDAFIPIFAIGSFYFLLKGLHEKNNISFFAAGLILFLGLTFNLAFIPLLVLFFFFAIFYILKNQAYVTSFLPGGFFFSLGFFLGPTLLYVLVHFNFLDLIKTIFQEVPHVHTRSYYIWLLYNVYDFLIFIGIPIAIIFFQQTKQLIISILTKHYKKIDLMLLSFLIMFIVVDISGSTRGETGRIWSIFMPFVIIPAAAYLTKITKFSTKLFVGVLFLLTVQLLVMQEFWVMLW